MDEIYCIPLHYIAAAFIGGAVGGGALALAIAYAIQAVIDFKRLKNARR